MVEGVEDPSVKGIVSVDECRPLGSTRPLTFEKMKHYQIQVFDDMRHYFEREDAFNDLTDSVGDILIEFDKAVGIINVWVSYL